MLNLPYWPFTIYFVRRLDVAGVPTTMYVRARADTGSDWEFEAELPEDFNHAHAGLAFENAIYAFNRAARKGLL